MILDWSSDQETAVQFDVIDADTGQPHPNMDVFYADDTSGLIRYYKRDDNGQFYHEASDGTPVTPAWTRANPGRQVWVGPGAEGERKEYADADVQVARAEERANIRIVRKP